MRKPPSAVDLLPPQWIAQAKVGNQLGMDIMPRPPIDPGDDDETPVTAEWWETVATHPAWYWRAVLSPGGAMFAFDPDSGSFGHFHRSDFDDIYTAPTRGQVRAFCRAIGVVI